MQKVVKKPKQKKWVAITKQVTDNISPDQAQTLFDAIKQEVGELKLDAQAREDLRLQFGVDEATANKWKTVDDVLSHIDIVDFAGKHPEALKNSIMAVLNTIANFFPVVAIASDIVAQVPESIVAKLVQFGGILTPEHLVHTAVKALANRQKPVIKENGDIVFFEDTEKEDTGETTELIVVCNDGMLSSLLRSLVETEDDFDEDNITGTRDGSVSLIVFNEKAWIAEQSESVFDGKILFIGNVKGTDDLQSRIDVKYDKLGVKYGWYENRAVISSSPKEIKSKEKYAELLSELQELPVQEKFKSNSKFKFNAAAVGKLLLATPLLLKDGYDESVALKRQQLILGICEMYKNDLEAFMTE